VGFRTIISSIFALRSWLRVRTDVSQSANDPIAVAPTQSLNFQLVQSEIELAWGLVKLAQGLRAMDRDREASDVFNKARNALLQGEKYSRDLTGPESIAAVSLLQILREAIEELREEDCG